MISLKNYEYKIDWYYKIEGLFSLPKYYFAFDQFGPTGFAWNLKTDEKSHLQMFLESKT